MGRKSNYQREVVSRRGRSRVVGTVCHPGATAPAGHRPCLSPNRASLLCHLTQLSIHSVVPKMGFNLANIWGKLFAICLINVLANVHPLVWDQNVQEGKHPSPAIFGLLKTFTFHQRTVDSTKGGFHEIFVQEEMQK